MATNTSSTAPVVPSAALLVFCTKLQICRGNFFLRADRNHAGTGRTGGDGIGRRRLVAGIFRGGFGVGGDDGDGLGIGRDDVGANGGRRGDGGDELFHRVLKLFLVLIFQQTAGDAQRHGQQRDERDKRGVGQRRRAHETAVADELPDDEHPKMHEAFEPAFEQKNFIFGTDGGTGKNFNEAGNPFAVHVADTLTKCAAKSTAR